MDANFSFPEPEISMSDSTTPWEWATIYCGLLVTAQICFGFSFSVVTVSPLYILSALGIHLRSSRESATISSKGFKQFLYSWTASRCTHIDLTWANQGFSKSFLPGLPTHISSKCLELPNKKEDCARKSALENHGL
jgi:hypothetical protein